MTDLHLLMTDLHFLILRRKRPARYWNYNVAFGLINSLKLRCSPNMSYSLSLSLQIHLPFPNYSSLSFHFKSDWSFTSESFQCSPISFQSFLRKISYPRSCNLSCFSRLNKSSIKDL